IWKLQFRELRLQRRQLGEHSQPLLTWQDFLSFFAHLGCEQTEPDLADLGLAGPELQEFLKRAGPRGHLMRDGAMDYHQMPFDILEDSLVCGGCTPPIVLGLQAVDWHNPGQGICAIPIPRGLPYHGW